MTRRADLLNRTAKRLLAQSGYAVYHRDMIARALRAEGWTPTSDAAYNRIVGDVQRTARTLYVDSLPKAWS
jgi:hypothetical protein